MTSSYNILCHLVQNFMYCLWITSDRILLLVITVSPGVADNYNRNYNLCFSAFQFLKSVHNILHKDNNLLPMYSLLALHVLCQNSPISVFTIAYSSMMLLKLPTVSSIDAPVYHIFWVIDFDYFGISLNICRLKTEESTCLLHSCGCFDFIDIMLYVKSIFPKHV